MNERKRKATVNLNTMTSTFSLFHQQKIHWRVISSRKIVYLTFFGVEALVCLSVLVFAAPSDFFDDLVDFIVLSFLTFWAIATLAMIVGLLTTALSSAAEIR
jgi:hypothetical protein